MIDQKRLKELLSYEPQTGRLTWIESGEDAGCRMTTGYVIVGVDGDLYLAHRLAWLWMTGSWPVAYIDHVNRAKSDNRWSNLRAASAAQNAANTGPRATSKSRVKGVSWCKSAKKWRATIVVDGKQRSLGRYDLLEDAARAYKKEAILAFGAYAEQAATELGVRFVDLEPHQ